MGTLGTRADGEPPTACRLQSTLPFVTRLTARLDGLQVTLATRPPSGGHRPRS